MVIGARQETRLIHPRIRSLLYCAGYALRSKGMAEVSDVERMTCSQPRTFETELPARSLARVLKQIEAAVAQPYGSTLA